jgi:hypothetical protein
VALCELRHLFRFVALDNLAIALVYSFEHQGHSEATLKTLQPQREALFEMPQGNPGRAMKCNLAESPSPASARWERHIVSRSSKSLSSGLELDADREGVSWRDAAASDLSNVSYALDDAAQRLRMSGVHTMGPACDGNHQKL